MKKRIIKTVSISMAVIVAAAGIGYNAFRNDEQKVIADESEDAKTIEDTIENNVTFNSVGDDKEETVYVISDANGNVTKTIVSDWLKNKDGNATITDKTDLSDIENVKSDADYTEGKDGEITWNANGEDVYYQGTSDKKLPVDVKVTYLLDGKEVTPTEIAGKSGKLTIRFDYTNNQKSDVVINGIKNEMYVPFTMISGMILDSATCSNVEVNSGKVISDGNRYVVVGLAFPGMNENLDLAEMTNDDSMDFPETVEVTADVKDFSLALTLTMGSADLISSVNLDKVTALDDLKEVVNKLVKSTNALENGSKDLNDGLNTLKSSFATYSGGVKMYINTVSSNLGLLNKNMAPFGTGTQTALNGVNEIISKLEGDAGAVNGSNSLSSGSSELNSGLNSLANSIGTPGSNDNNTVAGAINNIANGTSTLMGYVENMLAAFDDTKTSYGLTNGSKAVADGVSDLQTQLTTMVSTIQTTIAENQTKINQLTAVLTGGKNPATGADLTAEEVEYYNASILQLTGANTALQTMLESMDPEEMSTKLTTLTTGANDLSNGISELQGGISEFKTQGGQLIAGTAALNGKMTELTAGIAKLQAGSKQVSDGAAALSNGVNTLYMAMKNELQPGLVQLSDGANQLSDAVNKLDEGTKTTSKDVSTLLSGTDQVTSGIDKLAAGATTLSQGMTQFNDEAITKVSDFVDGDLTTIVTKIKETVNLSKDYNIYSDAAEGKSTSVKFIYETEGINK